jgi:molybdopterin molybdotransferase
MQTVDKPNRFRRRAISLEEAQSLLLERTSLLPHEEVSLSAAWNRRLGEAIMSPHPVPAFRRAGMDGYAVRAEDLRLASPEQPALLNVLESLPCGVIPSRRVDSGQATRIMTGGMVPEGADAVVMLEMTTTEEREGQTCVLIGKPIAKGLNIADIGSEIAQGELLLNAGRRIGAGETALLATSGYANVRVARRPRVAILATGSELLDVHEPLAPAKIRNSNAPMLAALVREAGAEPIVLGKVPDGVEEARATLLEGLRSCDLLLTTGGVSVGDYDVMVEVLAATEVELLFNKITMRPGSPTSAAMMEGKPLVALSGNPGACFVCFHLLVRPILRKMLSESQPLPRRFQAWLGVDFPKVNAYSRYLRAYTELSEGAVWVYPTGDDKSSHMTTILDADCLIEIPPVKEGLAKGHLVTAWRLE